MSPSSQRVWIEIEKYLYSGDGKSSPSSQRVWIEIENPVTSFTVPLSPSSQRVWIEIVVQHRHSFRPDGHPLHRGCGLKLCLTTAWLYYIKVTLFTEGVDWNLKLKKSIKKLVRSPSSQRVWIEIRSSSNFRALLKASPSSQRVWIEITCFWSTDSVGEVTLFTEGVDWNSNPKHMTINLWPVTLFTEGVDWNQKS